MRKRLVGAAVAGLTLVGASTGLGIAAASAQSGTAGRSTDHKAVKTVAATKPSTAVPGPAAAPLFLGSAASSTKNPKSSSRTPSSGTHQCPDMGSGTGSSGSSSAHTGTSATAALS